MFCKFHIRDRIWLSRRRPAWDVRSDHFKCLIVKHDCNTAVKVTHRFKKRQKESASCWFLAFYLEAALSAFLCALAMTRVWTWGVKRQNTTTLASSSAHYLFNLSCSCAGCAPPGGCKYPFKFRKLCGVNFTLVNLHCATCTLHLYALDYCSTCFWDFAVWCGTDRHLAFVDHPCGCRCWWVQFCRLTLAKMRPNALR